MGQQRKNEKQPSGARLNTGKQALLDTGRPFPQRVSKLREARGGKCQDCGAVDGEYRKILIGKTRTGKDKYKSELVQLEFAHIKPTGLNGKGRGQTARYYDIVNKPDSYKLVCQRCHKKPENQPRGVLL